MITKMKKLTFLVYHKEYTEFLNELRNLGVVHVVEKQQGVAENTELQEKLHFSARIATTLKFLQNFPRPKGAILAAEAGAPEHGIRVLDEADALQDEMIRLQVQQQTYVKEREALRVWGDFTPADIGRLTDAGLHIGFYSCPEGQYRTEWEGAYDAIVINRVSSKVYFVTVTRSGTEVDLDAEPAKLPAHSLSQLDALLAETTASLEAADKQLAELADRGIPSLKALQKEVQSHIEFARVVLSAEQTVGEKLMLLQGWAPASCENLIREYLDDSNVYYEMVSPTPDDNVPVQLNNKGLLAWFEPICKLYMLPKYNELDLTPFFAPFFMLFFGLCLGDSGYGLFLFVGVTGYRLIAKSVSVTLKPVLSLVQLLGVSTFFCGLLTGTFFGADLYNLPWPFLQKLKSAIFLDNNDMFQLSLVLGAVQILFGMVLKAVNQTIQFGFRYAVATIGWIVLLVSTAVAALLPGVLPMGGTVHLVILGVSAGMIFLYNSPGKNIFINIGLGLWDSYNMVTGLLGDILSYVRLFALGLSGGILASVFNSLAVGMSPDHVVAGPIFMVLIFVIGHAINMFMNVLGAMVHPMRLTFVEFFKNSGYEGGGKEYKPFKN